MVLSVSTLPLPLPEREGNWEHAPAKEKASMSQVRWRFTRNGRLLCALAMISFLPSTSGGAEAVTWDLDALYKAPRSAEARFKETGVRGIYYDGVPFQGKPTRVFAWIGLPDSPKSSKVPGMVLVHGGAGKAYADWVRLWNARGYAAIAMDTCGADGSGKRMLDNAGPRGWDDALTQCEWPVTDQWAYHAVADIVLAHSLLRSLPEVDSDKIGLTGISWGGFLACITAGVDDRFKFVAPVYGCGFLGEDSVWKPALDSLGPELSASWLARWDPAVYLPRAKMPFLWVTGDMDYAFPLGSFQKSYRLPPGKRYLAIRHDMPHGQTQGATAPEILAFAQQINCHEAPLARMSEQGNDGNSAWAKFVAEDSLSKAQLVTTKDPGPWSQRKWTVNDAELDKSAGRTAARLPDGTRAFYFILLDDRGCVASSEHVELQ